MNVARRINGNCYCCGVCAIACPKGIIQMQLSDAGVYIPVITDETQCVHCSLCEEVCSHLDQRNILVKPHVLLPNHFAIVAVPCAMKFPNIAGKSVRCV